MHTPTREASLSLPNTLNANKPSLWWLEIFCLAILGLVARMGGRKASLFSSPAQVGGPGPVGVFMLTSLLER